MRDNCVRFNLETGELSCDGISVWRTLYVRLNSALTLKHGSPRISKLKEPK